jgi:hypothetical protein
MSEELKMTNLGVYLHKILVRNMSERSHVEGMTLVVTYLFKHWYKKVEEMPKGKR